MLRERTPQAKKLKEKGPKLDDLPWLGTREHHEIKNKIKKKNRKYLRAGKAGGFADLSARVKPEEKKKRSPRSNTLSFSDRFARAKPESKMKKKKTTRNLWTNAGLAKCCCRCIIEATLNIGGEHGGYCCKGDEKERPVLW